MQARRGAGAETQGTGQFDEAGVEEILRLVEAAKVRGIARRRRRFRRRLLVLLIAVLVLCAVAAVRIGFGAGDKQTAKKPSTAPAGSSSVAKTPGTRSIPDFVWVAVKGAVRYRVEFLLGGRVVQTARTSVPRLHVAAARLPPGRYRWRVWALDKSGVPVGGAIVDASVTIR